MADVDVWKHEFNAALDKDADHSYVLAVTEKGYGKRINIDHFRTQKRGGKGQYVIKFKSKADADALCCMRVCNAGDEVVLSTKKGTILRQSTDEITSKSRKASGFTLQRIAEDDAIVMVDIVPAAIVEQNRAESNRHNSEAEEGEESFSHSIVSNNEQSEMENAFVD